MNGLAGTGIGIPQIAGDQQSNPFGNLIQSIAQLNAQQAAQREQAMPTRSLDPGESRDSQVVGGRSINLPGARGDGGATQGAAMQDLAGALSGLSPEERDKMIRYQNTQTNRWGGGDRLSGVMRFGQDMYNQIQEKRLRDDVTGIMSSQEEGKEQAALDEKTAAVDRIFNLAAEAYGPEVARNIAVEAYNNPDVLEKIVDELGEEPAGPTDRGRQVQERRDDVAANPDAYSSYSEKEIQNYIATGDFVSQKTTTSTPNRIQGDYEVFQDGTGKWQKRLLEGSETHKNMIDANQENQMRAISAIAEAEDNLQVLSGVGDDVSWLTAGFIGDNTSGIAGTPAATFKANLSSAQAQQAFTALMDMRAASPTGGALGNVSNRELEMLQNSVRGLQQDMSPEALKKNLTELQDLTMKNIWLLQNDAKLAEMIETKGIEAARRYAAKGKENYVKERRAMSAPENVEMIDQFNAAMAIANPEEQQKMLRQFKEGNGFVPGEYLQ